MLDVPVIVGEPADMIRRLTCLLVLTIAGGCTSATKSPLIIADRVVDLSYSFNEQTIYWPTAQPFKMQRVAFGMTPGGYFYYANNISMAEHGGTHMDAPLHFAEGKITAEQVPLADCIGPACVIDVSRQCARNPDYRMTLDDVRLWERSHGRIPDGAIVVMFSGWGQFWPDKKKYLGTDVPGDVVNLHFPGFSKEVAEFLVNERDIAAVAIDTPSIDCGQSKDFIVHQIINGANKPGFENVANVEKLPASGATMIALPLKIERGSGAPARIIAVLP